jgi:hypothetical protein
MLLIRHMVRIAWCAAKLTLRSLGNFGFSRSIFQKECPNLHPNPLPRRNAAIPPPCFGLRAGNYLLPSLQHTQIRVI